MPKRRWDRTSPSSHRHNHQGYDFSRLPEPGADGSRPTPVEELIPRGDFPHCLQGQYIAIDDLTGEVVNVADKGRLLIFRVSSAERQLVAISARDGQVCLKVSSPDQRVWEWDYVIPTAEK